jgi:hypothetical protein
MTNEEILELYKLQSQNVRKLEQVKRNLIKDINFHLRKSDDFQVEIKTKLLALLYCAWSEAQFTQIVYTPSAFSQSEISHIKSINTIFGKWEKMINLAIAKVGSWDKNSDLHNRKKNLHNIITKYIKEPSEIRNKIAHGQWFYALNSKNTAESKELTQKLANLDSEKLIQQFEVHKFLGLIIRDLVQSPNKGFHNNYWINLTALEEYIDKTKNRNIETRKQKLERKPINQYASN